MVMIHVPMTDSAFPVIQEVVVLIRVPTAVGHAIRTGRAALRCR